MFNKVILVGNLTRDVELRYLPNQSALAKLGLATNRRYKKQDGSQGEEVCFIDVNLFGRTAEIANQYLKKGSSVLIEGRLVLDTWMDNNGQKKSKHSITAESMQMLGRPQNSNETYGNNQEDNYSSEYTAPNSPNYAQQKPQNTTKEQEIPVIDINDEEIPF